MVSNAVVGAGAMLAAIALYYGWLAPHLNGILAACFVERSSRYSGLAHFEVAATLRLGFAGLNQALFFFLLLWCGLSTSGALFIWPPSPILLGQGVLLGLAEAALIAFASNVTVRSLALCGSAAGAYASADQDSWQWVSRGGWMRSFLNAMRTLPPALSMTLVVLYVAFEEAVFRGLVIGMLRPLGEMSALAISVFCFALAQRFNMPSWKSAAFPVLGALIMGTIHGILFLAVPDLLPLIVAHVIAFIVVAL